MPIDYRARIVRDPMIAAGEPVIRGTRVTLRTVLASLAEGASEGEIVADFPTLTADDVRAAVAFAAASALEDLPLTDFLAKVDAGLAELDAGQGIPHKEVTRRLDLWSATNSRVAALDWSNCPVVESIPGKVSGAWVFKGTRTPAAILFENLKDGASVDEITEQFAVTREQIRAVLEFAARSLNPASDALPQAPPFVHCDPDILGGTPVFVGTRVPFRNLIDHLERCRARPGRTEARFLRLGWSATGRMPMVARNVGYQTPIHRVLADYVRKPVA